MVAPKLLVVGWSSFWRRQKHLGLIGFLFVHWQWSWKRSQCPLGSPKIASSPHLQCIFSSEGTTLSDNPASYRWLSHKYPPQNCWSQVEYSFIPIFRYQTRWYPHFRCQTLSDCCFPTCDRLLTATGSMTSPVELNGSWPSGTGLLTFRLRLGQKMPYPI